MKTYLEYKDDKSAKFWEIEVNGTTHSIRFGKFGSKGTIKTKEFESDEKALKDAGKLIAAKQKKGYLKIKCREDENSVLPPADKEVVKSDKTDTTQMLSDKDMKKLIARYKKKINLFIKETKYSDTGKRDELINFIYGESSETPVCASNDKNDFPEIVNVFAPIKEWSIIDRRILAYLTSNSWNYSKKSNEHFFSWFKDQIKEDEEVFGVVLKELESQGIPDDNKLFKQIIYWLDDLAMTNYTCVTIFGSKRYTKLPNSEKTSVGDYFLRKFDKDNNLIYKAQKRMSDPVFDLLVKHRYEDIKKKIPKLLDNGYNKLLALCEHDFEQYSPLVLQSITNDPDYLINDMRNIKILFDFAPDQYRELTLEWIKRALDHANEKMQNNVNADPFVSFHQGLWAEGVSEFLIWILEAFNTVMLSKVEDFITMFSIHSPRLSETIIKVADKKGIKILCNSLWFMNTYVAEEEFAYTIDLLNQLDTSDHSQEIWDLLKIKASKQNKLVIHYLINRKEQTINEAIERLSCGNEELEKTARQILSYFPDSEEAVSALNTQGDIPSNKPKYSFDALVKALHQYDGWDDFIEEEEDKEWLISSLRGEVRLIQTTFNANDKIKTGQSKIGGLPQLPDTIKWPEYNKEPLSFLAQINLSDVKSDFEKVLPPKGILYFFVAANHKIDWDKPYRNEYKVIFHEGELENCKYTSTPSNLTSKEIFKEQPLFFSDNYSVDIVKSVPNYDEVLELVENVCENFKTKQSQLDLSLFNNKDGEAQSFTKGKVLGAADQVQDYVEDEWGNNYRLLFQCNGKDAGWGGNMMIYFGITENELKNKDFSRVKLTLQGT